MVRWRFFRSERGCSVGCSSVRSAIWYLRRSIRSKLQPDRFVATAAYGDGGPWYIPVKEAYPQGGYEVSVANCAEDVDAQMSEGMQKILEA